MLVEYNKDTCTTHIKVTDEDFENALPGTAMHLWFELGQAILNYGNLQIKDGYRTGANCVRLITDEENTWLSIQD